MVVLRCAVPVLLSAALAYAVGSGDASTDLSTLESCREIASVISKASSVYYPCAYSDLEPLALAHNLPRRIAVSGRHQPLLDMEFFAICLFRAAWYTRGCWRHRKQRFVATSYIAYK